MKRLGRFLYVLIGFALLVTPGAFAANKGPMQVLSPVTAAGTKIPAGEYSVEWEGTGPDVELKIKKDQKVKATVSAKLLPLDHPFDDDAVVVKHNDDGSRSLMQIRFAGKKFALEIEKEVGGVMANSAK